MSIHRVLTVAELAAHLSPELCNKIGSELFETAGGREFFGQWNEIAQQTWTPEAVMDADLVQAAEELESLRFA